MTLCGEIPSSQFHYFCVIVGYLLTSLMCDRLGRRFSIMSTMVIAGAAGIASAGVSASSTNAISALVFVSKMAITCAFLISELLEDGTYYINATDSDPILFYGLSI